MKCLSFYLFLNVNIDRPNPVFMTGFVKTSVIFETVSQSLGRQCSEPISETFKDLSK